MKTLTQKSAIIKAKIEKAENITITTHLNPDGDAIGTGLGLLNLLRNAGKKCNMIIPNEAPKFLTWMKSATEILVYIKNPAKAQKLIAESDLIIFVDFNDLKRLGEAGEAFGNSGSYKILMDHHPDPLDFADLMISETGFGSASELVYSVIKAMGYKNYMDKEIAECFYAGIMTDTGNFSFACSYPEVWINISELIAFEIDRNHIYSSVYDNYSDSRMRLMGYCLHEKMQIITEYNTAIISLTEAEMNKFNYQPGDTEGFVNLPFSIKGIKFSVLFLEKKDHIKLSLRSRGNFSVNDFARKHFNGGGHTNAAGGEYQRPLAKATEKLVSLLENYKNELK